MSGAATAADAADARARARAELAALLPLGDAFARAVAAQGPVVAAAAPPARPASYVVDRHGKRVPIHFDLITERNETLRSRPAYGPPLGAIDSALVTAEVVRRFRNGMTTRELDAETAAICFQLATHHDDYECLAARLHVSDLHKRVPAGLAAAVAAITAAAPDPGSVRVGGELARVIRRAAAAVDARLVADRDYRFRFFGWQTLARGYLLRPTARREESTLLDDQPMERPQHLYMRIALGVFVCRPDGRGDEAPEAAFAARLADAFAFYDALSTQRVSNATPTMLNAGTIVPQLSSCFQLATGDDLGTLFDTVKTAAMTSKWSGGVSLWLHNVRAEGALIRKTGGRGSGVKRYIKILQEVQLYVDQGGNRPGAFATYLGVDHDDVFTYIAMARPKGEEALKSLNAPDLKYALWVPDLFVEALIAQIENAERVEAGGADDPAAGDWHLFSPDTAPGLHLAWGGEYRALVARYVAEGRHRRVVKAGDIVREAFKTWAQNGGLYWLHKDHVNRKSNLQNVAPICSSNLCVAAGTLVLTESGHVPIEGLAGREARVWNGKEWSTVAVRQTAAEAELVRVELDNGASLDCTPYHKFYDEGGREVRAGLLRPGAKLEKSPAWPRVAGGTSLAHAYTSGFFAADGHHTKGRARCQNPADEGGDVCRHHQSRAGHWPRDGQCRAWCGYNAANLYGAKKDLLDALDVHPDCAGLCTAADRLTVNLVDDLLPKDHVPLEADLESRLAWFAGLCDGDGCATRNGSNYSLQVSSVDRGFLERTRLMLQTLGCDPKVKLMNATRRAVFGAAEYECRPCYRLLVSSWDLDTLIHLGFRTNRLAFPGRATPARDARQFVKVVAVRAVPGVHPTYCFTEPLRHRGVFNGVLTGQCCEITLPSWSAFDAPDFARFHPDNGAGGEFGVCNLAAVCLESFLVERTFRCEAGAEPGTFTAVTGSFAASSLVWHDPAGGQARAAARGLSGAANMAGVAPGVELRGWGLDYVQIMGAAALELRALDRVIDLTFYPSEECRRSNQRHRPVGIGIMGLANVLARLGLAYGSPEACAVARAVAAAVYLGALRESCRLAEEAGPYASFAGSPISEGRLQPDLWVEAGHLAPGWEEQVAAATGGAITPAMWAEARAAARRGVRNGYLTACMPTASTSNIVGQNESFEPFTSNLYTRRTNAGEFTIANRHLMAELAALGLWDDRMRREVIAAGGSVQGVDRIPADVRRRYKTAREVHPSLLGRMAAAIAPFVCQSMSLNAYFDRPDLPRILRFLIENWRAGLKTGMYYCHTQPAAGAQKATARSGKQKPAPGGLTEQLDAAAAAPVRDRLAGALPGCVPAADGTCTMCAL